MRVGLCDLPSEEVVYVVGGIPVRVGRGDGSVDPMPHVEARHAGVSRGVPSTEHVCVDGVFLKGLVRFDMRGPEAERVLQVGGWVGGYCSINNVGGVCKRLVTGEAIGVGGGV